MGLYISQTSSPMYFQVFAVRSGGTMGVVVKGPFDKNVISFRYVHMNAIFYVTFTSHFFFISELLTSFQVCQRVPSSGNLKFMKHGTNSTIFAT